MGKIDTDAFVDQLLFQCAYALGTGAQMPIQRKAVTGLTKVTRPGFKKQMVDNVGDPTDEAQLEAEWGKSSAFILSCCVRIGQVAATNANTASPPHFSITQPDLKKAYNDVRVAFAAGLPGEFCPDWV